MGGGTKTGTSMPVFESLFWTKQQMYVRNQRKCTHVERSTQTRERPGWQAKAPLSLVHLVAPRELVMFVPVHCPGKDIVLLHIYRTQISKEVQTTAQ